MVAAGLKKYRDYTVCRTRRSIFPSRRGCRYPHRHWSIQGNETYRRRGLQRGSPARWLWWQINAL